MSQSDIDNWIAAHIKEASDGLQNCSVSELRRGEGTVRNYYIFKIDLVGSTVLLRTARAAKYVKVAHAYLSTVDRITRSRGAESEQTEYHGDSVLAFWPERGNSAEDALCAAIESHYAVHKLRRQLGINLHARLLLHCAPLTVARIGPWNETHRVAIGIPIHDVAKKEKEIGAGTIWVSDEFAKQFPQPGRSTFLERRYIEQTVTEQVEVTPPVPPDQTLGGLMGISGLPTYAGLLAPPPTPQQQATALMKALGQGSTASGMRLGDLVTAAPLPPRYEDRLVKKQVADGYTVKIVASYQKLRLPINVLAS